MTRRLLPMLLVLAALLALPAGASAAKTKVAVGLGDQNASMFDSPAYQALNLKKARYFIPWDTAVRPDQLAKADAFVIRAKQSGVKVLMHISTNKFSSTAKLPSVALYRTRVKSLIQRYRPMGVTEWGVWNEANHKTQPTFKSPTRAASYFKTMRSICKKCTIVALDVLDQKGVESYIRRWFKAAGKSRSKATIIGIHNYSEVNRKLTKGTDRFPGTARIVRQAKKGNSKAKFWYTETGGVVSFGNPFPCNPTRAANRTKYMFTLAKRHRKDVKRLYAYNWTSANCGRFDAGLVNADGSIRPGYTAFRNGLKNFTR